MGKQVSIPRVAEASTWKSTAAITRNKLGKVVNEQRRPDSNRLPSPYASLAPIQGVFLCSSYKKHNAIASKTQGIFLITVTTPHRSFFATV